MIRCSRIMIHFMNLFMNHFYFTVDESVCEISLKPLAVSPCVSFMMYERVVCDVCDVCVILYMFYVWQL